MTDELITFGILYYRKINMPNTCFVFGCKSGYRSSPVNTGQEKVCIFKAPADRRSLSTWRAAIPRSDKILSSKDHVCSKHFEAEE